MLKKIITILILLVIFISCSQMTVKEKISKREELDKMAKTTITKLIAKTPEIKGKIENSKGYIVANMKVTKIPVFGVGGGPAVLIDSKTNRHIYYDVSRLDFGGGWGARSYKVLLIINSDELLKEFENGKWLFEFGGEASVGKVAADENSGALVKELEAFILADGGVSATITVRAIKLKVNKELTEK